VDAGDVRAKGSFDNVLVDIEVADDDPEKIEDRTVHAQ
jgi:hypothetical protein